MSLGILYFAGSVARGDDDYSRTFSRMIPLLFVCISNNNDKNNFYISNVRRLYFVTLVISFWQLLTAFNRSAEFQFAIIWGAPDGTISHLRRMVKLHFVFPGFLTVLTYKLNTL